jgi:hypothetical protein
MVLALQGLALAWPSPLLLGLDYTTTFIMQPAERFLVSPVNYVVHSNSYACSQPRGPWAKEVHFFNQWPLPHPPKRRFLECFPRRAWNIAKHPNPNSFTLVDATPDYMFNAMAPARIKAMWPQAKFVVLLRVSR